MADGSVVIEATLDDSKLNKKYASVSAKMDKLKSSISKGETEHNALAEQLRQAQTEAVKTLENVERLKAALADTEKTLSFNISGRNVNADEYVTALETQARLKAELAEAEKQLEQQEKAAQKLEAQDTKVLDKLQRQTAEMRQQESIAGQINAQQAQKASESMLSLKGGADAAGEAATMAIPSFSKLFTSVLKWGFGIRTIFQLVKKLKAAVAESYKALAKYSPETKKNLDALRSSLADLKGAWGSAFAPVIDAVMPILQRLIDYLIKAGNAVAEFMAVLSGASVYRRAVSKAEKLGDAYGGIGGAVADANREFAKFDELNVLGGDNGGGGGGGSGYEYTETPVNLDSIAAKMALNIQDVLFNWENLTPESIAKKALSGLSILVGGAFGFAIGGFPGAIVGASAGLLLSAYIESVIFNNDGKLSATEIVKSLCIVLTAAMGGIIGFTFGNIPGALIGMSIGIALQLWANNIDFKTKIYDPVKKWLWDDGILAAWNEVKTLWNETINSFKFDPPKITLPHLSVMWENTDSILANFFGLTKLPRFNVQWYARGGIVNGTTLFGAGEAGKEAVIPLERHTEWIKMVADGIADILVDRFAIDMPPLPAMAGGGIIPPQIGAQIARNSVTSENNALFGIMERLQSIENLLASQPIEVSSEIALDGRKVGESVTRYQRNTDRARGR